MEHDEDTKKARTRGDLLELLFYMVLGILPFVVAVLTGSEIDGQVACGWVLFLVAAIPLARALVRWLSGSRSNRRPSRPSRGSPPTYP
ncbi:MAG: hypothetical protein U0230_23040 [Polyangiales bacterium]